MSSGLSFAINRLRFDQHYVPAAHTRLTTNFANLARGACRQQNLRNTLQMIDNRFNALADWDNPKGDRYAVGLDIVSADVTVRDEALPLIEMLQTTVVDRHTGARTPGIVGNSFSSYVRDYDFSVLLPAHNHGQEAFSVPADFGELHGKLFKALLASAAYQSQFSKAPVICLSVSTSREYQRTSHQHPILGVEYLQDDYSLTDAYFQKMGLTVRYFMPRYSAAPLAFYFSGDLLSDYSDLELISTISTMDSFQRIYRPEIYNANSPAGARYQPSLQQQDHSLTRIHYDRDERSRLATEQGTFVQAHFIIPYKDLLDQWSARFAA